MQAGRRRCWSVPALSPSAARRHGSSAAHPGSVPRGRALKCEHGAWSWDAVFRGMKSVCAGPQVGEMSMSAERQGLWQRLMSPKHRRDEHRELWMFGGPRSRWVHLVLSIAFWSGFIVVVLVAPTGSKDPASSSLGSGFSLPCSGLATRPTLGCRHRRARRSREIASSCAMAAASPKSSGLGSCGYVRTSNRDGPRAS